MDRRGFLKRLAALGLVVPAAELVERSYFFGPWSQAKPEFDPSIWAWPPPDGWRAVRVKLPDGGVWPRGSSTETLITISDQKYTAFTLTNEDFMAARRWLLDGP